MSLYDFLQTQGSVGCTQCPFAGEGAPCDQGAGYTMMDEHGDCPVNNINSQADLAAAQFPNE